MIRQFKKSPPYTKVALAIDAVEKKLPWLSSRSAYWKSWQSWQSWKSWCALKAGLWQDGFFNDFHSVIDTDLDLRNLGLAINHKRIKYGWRLDELNELAASKNYASHSADPHLNALLASLFHEGGEDARTIEFLNRALTQDARAVGGYLGLSCFALEQRVALPAIPRKTVEMMLNLCKKFQRFSDFFNTNLRGRKIAVVGNSELATHCSEGDFIDGHDHVVRFNNFPTDRRYEKDRGKKITLWVRNPSVHEVPRREDIEPQAIMFSSPLLLHTKNGNWRWMLEYGQRDEDLVLFDAAAFRALVQKLDAPPSAGLLAVQNIGEVTDDLSQIHFLGFDFNTGSQSHYFDNQKPGTRHNWASERSIFSKITGRSTTAG